MPAAGIWRRSTMGAAFVLSGGGEQLRQILYGIDLDTGMVVSRVGRELAWPVIVFNEIGKGGDFTGPIPVQLEKMDLNVLYNAHVQWTKKIPLDLKNRHRQFWGMKPVSTSKWSPA